MPAEGTVYFGDKPYKFTPQNCYCRLDWGRGVWPYKINWYWGGASGKTTDGHEIWFSHGHSYEDPALHDKNMVGYDGRGHKLGSIKFHVPENPMDPWQFTSEDGRFEMTLKPIFHHRSGMNFVIFTSKSVIAYGYYSGYPLGCACSQFQATAIAITARMISGTYIVAGDSWACSKRRRSRGWPAKVKYQRRNM